MPDDIYTRNGYRDRRDYLGTLADQYGVDFHTVAAMAEILGKDEDFDGLVTELENF